MEKKKNVPELDELVVVTVTKIFPYGAFCKLEDYDMDAFLHVSEVSSGWVKNIRNFLKEGQRLVVRVHRVIPEKNMVDVSLKRVTEAEQQRKLEQIKRDKRTIKLLEVAKERIASSGKETKLSVEQVKSILDSNFDDAFTAFEKAVTEGENALKKTKLPAEWIEAIVEIAKENIKKQVKVIKGKLFLRCTKEGGINVIKKLLDAPSDSGISVHYLGAPYYQIVVQDDDFKKCEKKLKQFIENMTKSASKEECEIKFERTEE
ncbi:MAG: translation initiation factor IF-2 subunit alpha [Candidatus Micrarchaeota archaeon]|nr:translation initiation factor IF-2 subunit alpha [Candidatus Micrarchaeota archaeon]